MALIGRPDKIAVYGTLLAGLDGQRLAGVEGRLKLLGPCRLPGLLYDLGEYPGLVPGEGEVAGELYSVEDPATVAKLDCYEGFDEGKPERSLFVRRRVKLGAPASSCWAYFYLGDVTGNPLIPSGDWRKRDRD